MRPRLSRARNRFFSNGLRPAARSSADPAPLHRRRPRGSVERAIDIFLLGLRRRLSRAPTLRRHVVTRILVTECRHVRSRIRECECRSSPCARGRSRQHVVGRFFPFAHYRPCARGAAAARDLQIFVKRRPSVRGRVRPSWREFGGVNAPPGVRMRMRRWLARVSGRAPKRAISIRAYAGVAAVRPPAPPLPSKPPPCAKTHDLRP